MTPERVLAAVLAWGTWASAAGIAAGLALSDARVVAAGIVAMIALPFVRVAIMLVAFALARDLRAALVAAVVLLVLVAGFALGVVGPGA